MLALGVLMRAREDIRCGPIAPGPDVRLALAVLFACSRSGDRAPYDRFWRNLGSDQPSASSENMGNILRCNAAHAYFEWIMRDVGAPGHAGYSSMVNRLAGKGKASAPPSL